MFQLLVLLFVTYLIQFIHIGVVRHTWAFHKKFSVLNMHYVKTELRYDGEFLHVARLQQKQQQ